MTCAPRRTRTYNPRIKRTPAASRSTHVALWPRQSVRADVAWFAAGWGHVGVRSSRPDPTRHPTVADRHAGSPAVTTTGTPAGGDSSSRTVGEAAGCGCVRAQAVGNGGSWAGAARVGCGTSLLCRTPTRPRYEGQPADVHLHLGWCSSPGQSSDGLALPLYDGLPASMGRDPPLRHATQPQHAFGRLAVRLGH
jgi:hypothetical protein